MSTENSPSSERKPAHSLNGPDITVNARDVFNIDVDLEIPAFSTPSEYVPDLDEAYVFDKDTTLAILAGFGFNRRVMVQVIMGPVNPPILNRLQHA